MRSLSVLLSSLLWSLAFAADAEQIAAAGIDDHAAATYFVHDKYVFALNVVANGDVYYHMNAPSSHSWIGIGFGSSMDNVRMLVSYLAADGAQLINSCRMSYGHSEPVHDPDCIIEGVDNDEYAPYHNSISPSGTLIAHAVCRNCSTWPGGALDLSNEVQPFIYALGPNETLHSDDLNAPLRLHNFYGGFTMNMTKASNTTGDYGRVPAPQDPALQSGYAFWAFASYYSSQVYGVGTLTAWSPITHAVFMTIAFVLIFPLGAISLRLVRRATFHAGVQVLGMAFVIIGFGFGIYTASLFNKSKHYNSVHQIVGLAIIGGLLLQAGLGLSHHLIFIRSGRATVMGKGHRVLGVGIMALGIINGGIGFNFAQNNHVPYIIAVPIMALILGGFATWVHFYNRKHLFGPEKEGFIRDHGSDDPPAEYEMQTAPFAKKGPVQTPRTPFFSKQRWQDPDSYRAQLVKWNTEENSGQESRYTDDPSADAKNPVSTKWAAVSVD